MRTVTTTAPLPPGQEAVAGFPRFGTHLNHRPPRIPAAPSIAIAGAVSAPATLALGELDRLPRTEVEAGFHCVSGWSAVGLRWSGVPFAAFFAAVLEPLRAPGATVTHLVLGGLDGYRVVVALEDALADDVLLADGLDGAPLGPDHGAPLRFVSPGQYGYVSVKHLARVELHAGDPGENFSSVHPLGRAFLRGPLFQRHPRGRVALEERHRYLPAWVVRPLYRPLRGPIAALSARGAERRSAS